jgi:hypothetical protein
MNEERIALVLIVSALLWLVALVAAFWLIGAVAGILVILAGACLFGWWLVRVIRSEPDPEPEPPAPGSAER